MMIFKVKDKGLLIITLILIVVHAYNTIFLSLVISNVIAAATQKSTDLLVKYSIYGFVGFLLFTLLGILNAKLKNELVFRLNTSIKETLINDIFKNENNFATYNKNLSILTNDLKQLETKAIEAELLIIKLLATFMFAIITAFLGFDNIIALAFLIGSFIPTIISLLFKNKISHASKKWMNFNILYTNKLKDYLSGLETIKVYNVEDNFKDSAIIQANSMEDSLKDMNIKVDVVNEIIWFGIMVFSMLIPFIIGVFRVIDSSVTLASFIGIVYLSNSFRGPSSQVIQIINGHSTTKNIRLRLIDAINRSYQDNQLETIDEFDSVELKNVAFNYNNKTIFNNLNIKINSGDKILITGPTGSGKTTLLRLINQTLTFNSGNYYLNGKESSNNTLFSFIKQNPAIFNDSLINNITLGNIYSEEDIKRAINISCLDEVVSEKGLDFIVEMDGNNLSAGEVQRIEIARAILSNRKIILADEMTSALDYETAVKIRENIFNENYTIVEVAHNVDNSNKDKYNKIWQIKDL